MPQRTHGQSRRTPEYKAWGAIKQRCLNPKEKMYKHYGGRGITICDEWKEDFISFFEYVGKRPSNLHSIDRIDNEKGYEPGNVEWVTKDVQMHNRRAYSKSGFKGAYWSGYGWFSSITRKGQTYHLGTFKTPQEASQAYLEAQKRIYA